MTSEKVSAEYPKLYSYIKKRFRSNNLGYCGYTSPDGKIDYCAGLFRWNILSISPAGTHLAGRLMHYSSRVPARRIRMKKFDSIY
jgi:hypothetical protein